TPQPSISLVKSGAVVDTDGDGTTEVGETIHYTFTVTNTGNVSVNGIVVNDAIITTSPITVGDLAPGASLVVTGDYVLTQPDLDGCNFTNTATASGATLLGTAVTDISDNDNDPTNGADTPTVTALTQSPSITLVKSGVYVDNDGNNQLNIGDTVTYTFVITNTGNVTVNDLSLTDVILSNNPLTLTTTSLAPGASSSPVFTYNITVEDINAGQVVNSADITASTNCGATLNVASDSDDPTLPNNDDPTVTILPDVSSLTMIKTSVLLDNGTPTNYADDTIRYTFTVTNTGNVIITNVVVNDSPIGINGIPVVPSTLAPGQSGSYTTTDATDYHVTAADYNLGLVINSAVAIGFNPDNEPVTDISDNNDPAQTGPSDPTVTILTHNPQLTFVKTGTLSEDGATISYTFDVYNTGNVSISNLTINDALITNGSNIPVVPPTLAPGEVGHATVSYTITQADYDAGMVVNTATVSGEDDNDPLTPPIKDVSDSNDPTLPGSDDPTVVLLQASSITIVKTGYFVDDNNDGFASPGETIRFDFTVMNTGHTTLYNVTVQDTYIAGVEVFGDPIVLAPGETAPEGHFYGIYHITQEDINAGSVTNQASVRGYTDTGTLAAQDASDNLDPLLDNPTVVPLLDGCTIKVYNLVSPNGDGYYDSLFIQGIACYPENTVEIYNRWGILVYETKGYDNEGNSFKGYSEGRTTIDKSAGLPEGTYYWVIKYKSGNDTKEKAGFLHLTR
ncbi:MAG: gliding motility-associated C-terminal domain-containing protein, partial [Flavobacterium sp.]|nr:gliding motility-associated C-terminal domain-containing protein [Flavobacterium sp.]